VPPWDSLREAVERAVPALLALPDALTANPPAPGKWSPREIVGHLIDSASNNHRRFVLAQQQEDLVFSGYAQDAWVAAQRYQDAPWEELVSLWRQFNLHLARVMEAAPASDRTSGRCGRINPLRSSTSCATTSSISSIICGRFSRPALRTNPGRHERHVRLGPRLPETHLDRRRIVVLALCAECLSQAR
jgi:hypothetical protein